MASITFAVDNELKTRMNKFPWVNWSEIARQELIRREKLEDLHKQLDSKEEKELTKWSVELGRKVNKAALKRIVSQLSPKERKELGL